MHCRCDKETSKQLSEGYVGKLCDMMREEQNVLGELHLVMLYPVA
jgi:hypothetical protein